MTKPDGNPPEPNNDVSPAWGTWEELLLAFAVNRHGAGAWDSIASELQKRSSDPNLSLTAQNCRLKYLDLKRRFMTQNDDSDDAVRDDKSSDESVPLLEELRKLRVAELRREVQRYDLNIESLELKMKRMEEDRDKNSRKEKSESDLQKKREEVRGAEPTIVGEPIALDESEKDQMSVNGSNSTDLGAEKTRAGEKDFEPAGTGVEEVRQNRTARTNEEPAVLKTEPVLKQTREDSCNGSSSSIEKEPDREAQTKPASGSAELVESGAESEGDREEEATKENSDVLSSASRSRKEEEGNDKVRCGNTSGEEREHEDQSPAVKDWSAESQPLADFLQAIRAHKLGSTFERRLRSQESSKYQKLILQHVDLVTIETRLKQGRYSGSAGKFFRDLLLLVNNALVFFNKKSPEANAATEVRRLILKEMSQKYAKSDSSSGKQVSLHSLSTQKEEAEPLNSLLLKPRLSGPLIVCRKRSSIAAKASSGTSSSGADKKKEKAPLLAEEKEKDTTKLQTSQPSGNSDEQKITKKRTRDRYPSSSANSKKNGKNQSNNSNNNKNSVESGKNQGKVGSSSQHAEPKSDSKKNQSTVDSKKRGAANFLNRMKQGSSSNNGVLLDALKNTPLTSESTSGKGGSETKKNDSSKRTDKKDQGGSRRISESRQAKEKDSPSKKNVGRPPKRGAPPPPPPPSLGKRGRERGGETESSGSKQQAKKRSRKL